MTDTIIDLAVKLVFAALSALLMRYVIPWVKDKLKYDTVKRGVQAAEKIKEAGADIDKKQYVLDFLAEKGVKITPEIQTLIESAVKELDIATENIKKELLTEKR